MLRNVRHAAARMSAAMNMLPVHSRCVSTADVANSGELSADSGDADWASMMPDTAASAVWKGVTRFYRRVEVVSSAERSGEVPSGQNSKNKRDNETFRILIDGRELRSNGMNELAVPSRALAVAIAAEFALQRGMVTPSSQPLYSLLSSAVDSFEERRGEEGADEGAEEDRREAEERAQRLAAFDEAFVMRGMDTAAAEAFMRAADSASTPQHAAAGVTGRHHSGAMTASSITGTGKLRDLMLDHLETDSACYRIDIDMADPAEKLLRKRQDKHYGPLLQWWKESFGCELGTAVGFGDVEHPDAAYMAAEDIVNTADPFLKAALSQLIGSTKSTVITLALVHRAIDIEQAFDASRVEEEFQISENGFVEDGHDTARAQLRVSIASASAFLHLLPKSNPLSLPSPSRKDYAEMLDTSITQRNARVTARRARMAAFLAAARKRLRQQFVDELRSKELK